MENLSLIDKEPTPVKIWIVTAATMLVAGCSYLPSTDLLNSAPPDKQMTYKFDTAQTASEPPPPEEKKATKGKQVAKKQRTTKQPKKAPEPTQAPAEQPAEQPEE